MTTPSVDLNIVMPYGVTVVGDGTIRAALATQHSKQHSTTGLKLAAGPCRVSASWAGAQDVELRLYGKGDAFKRVLTTINSGGVVVTVGALDGDFIQLVGKTSLPSGTTGTLEVYPLNFE